MKTVIIIASWSSGSTAVAGYLDKCGAYSCPPHLNTIDTLTPNSYEPLAYKKELSKLFDDLTFKEKGEAANFVNFFESWYSDETIKAKNLGLNHIVLKHPLQTFILPYLYQKLNPLFIFVTRPYDDIERTRKRRNWHEVYGSKGAKTIYSVSFNFLSNNSCPYIFIPFNTFISDINLRSKLLDFIDLSPSEEQITSAESFLRKK